MSKTIRINFEIDRADNPPLYNELAKFAKGHKRASRLRTLAHAGLLAQEHQAPPRTVSDRKKTATVIDPVSAAAASELFGPSAD